MKIFTYVIKEMFLPIILLIRFVEDMKIALTNNPELCYMHALYDIEGRFSLGEEIIAKSSEYSFKYADNVLKGRFEIAEDTISKNALYSVLYAINVLKKRFEIAEDTILNDCDSSRMYLEFLLELDDNNKRLSENSDDSHSATKGYIGLPGGSYLPLIGSI